MLSDELSLDAGRPRLPEAFLKGGFFLPTVAKSQRGSCDFFFWGGGFCFLCIIVESYNRKHFEAPVVVVVVVVKYAMQIQLNSN